MQVEYFFAGGVSSLFTAGSHGQVAEIVVATYLPAGGFALGVKQFCETGIFRQERKIFIVARVVAVFRTQLNCCFQIFHRGLGLSGEAIESSHGVEHKIGLGSQFARAQQMIARFIPAPQIHHRNARLIMFLRRAKRRRRLLDHALFGDANMNLRAIGKFFAWPGNNLFKQFFRFREFLLMEMLHGLFVEFQLLLKAWINHLPDGLGVCRGLFIFLIFQ